MGNTTVIRSGLVSRNGRLMRADVKIHGSRISEVAPGIRPARTDEVIEASGLLVLPGFIDIHTHGAHGHDIMHGDENGLASLAAFYAAQGTTSFLATTLTGTREELTGALRRIGGTIESNPPGARILGVHLEGPYLSREFCGAQRKECIVTPSVDEFAAYNLAVRGHIRLVTLAPEAPGALELISYLVQQGIVVSIGHSGATYEQTMAAIEAGARSCTHIFNGMKGFHHHEPSVVGACLESGIYSEFICDGLHLAPATVRLLLQIKGLERLIAITDSTIAAGLPDGIYRQGPLELIVRQGDVQLRDGSRAGSTLTASRALKNMTEFTGRGIADCVRVLTANPASLLGLSASKGTVEKGKDADLVLLDRDGAPRYTMVEGRIVYRADQAGVGGRGDS